jgi:hypothetical protein
MIILYCLLCYLIFTTALRTVRQQLAERHVPRKHAVQNTFPYCKNIVGGVTLTFIGTLYRGVVERQWWSSYRDSYTYRRTYICVYICTHTCHNEAVGGGLVERQWYTALLETVIHTSETYSGIYIQTCSGSVLL